MKRPGFALPSVLWLIVAIGVFATLIMVRSRVDMGRIDVAEATARVRGAVDGAIEEAAFQLLDAEARVEMPPDTVYETEVAGIPVMVSIADVDGLVDLNGAPHDLLQIAGQAAGLPSDLVPVLASRIVDFRDTDSFTTPNGAEDPDYAAAGLAAQAKDAPFDSVSELQQVLGVDEAVYRAMRPLITIFSGRALTDPQKSPEQLRQAMGAQAAMATWNGQSRQQLYRIGASASLRGISFRREATVRISRNRTQPLVWLDWTILP